MNICIQILKKNPVKRKYLQIIYLLKKLNAEYIYKQLSKLNNKNQIYQ